MRLALYQPDIPQNCGALIRLAACLGVGLDIIEPCGFLLDDRRLRRAGLDYHALAAVKRHPGWTAFRADWQADRDSAGERPAEIGRASWRERVWQYGEITVVVGSLKKKTHHKTYQ